MTPPETDSSSAHQGPGSDRQDRPEGTAGTARTRRDVLALLVGAAVGWAGRPIAGHAADVRVPLPRIAVLRGPSPDAWPMGARLGREEVTRTAELLRREIRVVEVDLREGEDAAGVLGSAAHAGTSIVVAALTGDRWRALEDAVSDRGPLLLDARPVHPARAACRARVYRVGLPAAGDAGGPLLWHPSLFRYGATQLNDRFRTRFGRGMDGAAWAGWFALKVAGEAALRAGGGEAGALARFLTSEAAAFDGHKGRPLRFRASDHRLVQPAYVRGRSGSMDEVAWPGPAAACPGGAEGEAG